MRIRYVFAALSSAAFLLVFTAGVLAHHGTGISYDQSKQMTLNATVTEFRYANPHPQLSFDVKDDKGDVVHWIGELAPNPAQLVREGWNKKRSEGLLKPGTRVTITLAPSKAGTPVGVVNRIVNDKGEPIVVTGNAGGGAGAPAAGQRGQ